MNVKVPIPCMDYMVMARCHTYNHENYIEQTLNGFVMQQTSFPFCAVIIDDCSTDGTQDVIKQYLTDRCGTDVARGESDNMLWLIGTPIENSQCTLVVLLLKYNHYQKGLLMKPYYESWQDASKYEAQCEGDDYWMDPLKLQRQVDYLESHSDYSLCYTDYQTVDAQSDFINWRNHSLNIARSFRGDNFRELLKGNYIQTMTMLYRTEVIKNPDYQSGIDYALSLVCAIMGKCAYIPVKTACYRLHNTSATHTAMDYIGAASLKAWEYYVELYLSKAQYRRSAWEHLLICGTIDACLISKKRSGGVQAEQADRVLKHHPELKKYMWLGVLYRLRHTIVKRLKRTKKCE